MNVLPMPGRLRAFVISYADGDEQRADGDQQEPHREQARARNAAAVVAVIVSAAPSAIVRVVIARTASIGAARV